MNNITGQKTTTDQTFHRVCRFRGQILASEATCIRDALSRPRDTGWDSWRGGGRSIDADRRDSLNPVRSNEPCQPLRGNYTTLSLLLSLSPSLPFPLSPSRKENRFSQTIVSQHWKLFGTSAKARSLWQSALHDRKNLKNLLTPYLYTYTVFPRSKVRGHLLDYDKRGQMKFAMYVFCFVVHELDLFELSFRSISDVIHSENHRFQRFSKYLFQLSMIYIKYI